MAMEYPKFVQLAENAVRELTMEPERLHAVPGIREDVERALRTRWSDCTVKPFGSVINGTASRASDFDLTVLFADGASGTGIGEEDARLANLAAKTLRQYPHIFNYVNVPDKFFKTVNCVHASTGIPVDVSFRRVMNVQNTAMVRYFMNLDKRAFQLTIIIKRWAALRGVKIRHRDTVTGQAFTNYNITLLVIFYLQQRGVVPSVAELQRGGGAPPLIIDRWNAAFEEREFHTENDESLLALLGGFFEYYEGFDYRRYAISIMTGYPVDRRALRPGSELQLPPELAAYRDHTPVDTSPPFLMLECFDYNQPSGTIFNLIQFEIAAVAYRNLKSNEFLQFLLSVNL